MFIVVYRAENILTLHLTACCRIHILIEQLHHMTQARYGPY